MPIYEYGCPDCKRRVSIFFRTMSAAESGAATAACPRCGGQHLRRLVSKVSFIRADNFGDNPDRGGEAGDLDDMGAPGGADGADDDMDGFGDMPQGIDEEDPRSIARWARQMQRQTGEDLGPEFNTALTRIEAGEDPDRVMDDMEPEFGETGGVDDAGDDGGGEFE